MHDIDVFLIKQMLTAGHAHIFIFMVYDGSVSLFIEREQYHDLSYWKYWTYWIVPLCLQYLKYTIKWCHRQGIFEYITGRKKTKYVLM